MKKYLKLLSVILIAFMCVAKVEAAGANFAISTSANQVIVGKPVTVTLTISSSVPLGAWEYTLNYDSSVFKCTDSGPGLSYAGYVSNNKTYSTTYRYTFVALKSGTGTFYVDSTNALDFNEANLTPSNGSKKVKVITYAEYEASLSKNNNLKSLEVEGYEIDPVFDKDTLEYNVQVKEDATKINVIAKPEDGSASVNGAGELEVTAGTNAFEIVVVAENGSEKKYKLNVEVVDKDPIEVMVDNEKYTVVKVAANLSQPVGYTESTVTIKEYEIPAYYSEVTKYTLIGLKNEAGDIKLFIYNDGKYEKYVELNFGKLVIAALPLEDSLRGYNQSKIKIQDNEVECLEQSKKSRHKAIYGINVETGEKGLYLYDTKDDIAVRFDEKGNNTVEKELKIVTFAAIGLAFVTLICLICLLAKGSKKKQKKKETITEEPVFDEPKKKKNKKEKVDTNEVNELSEEKLIENMAKEENTDIVEDEPIKKGKKKQNVEAALEETDEFYDIFESDKKKKKKR